MRASGEEEREETELMDATVTGTLATRHVTAEPAPSKVTFVIGMIGMDDREEEEEEEVREALQRASLMEKSRSFEEEEEETAEGPEEVVLIES